MRFILSALLLIAACGLGQAGHAAQAGPLSGSREAQLAQVLAAIVPVGASRDWAAGQAAFPGARWAERTSDTAPTRVEDGITYPSLLDSLGYTDLLEGSIDLGGDRFRIILRGTPGQLVDLTLIAPEDTLIGRAALRQALAARGAGWRLLRCNPIGDANVPIIVELTAGSRSAIVEDTFSGQASAYVFSFAGVPYDPADPPGDCTDAGTGDLR